MAADRLYRWSWRKRLPERHGTLCRLICTGTLNSALVEFLEDGRRFVTDRRGLRRVRGPVLVVYDEVAEIPPEVWNRA